MNFHRSAIGELRARKTISAQRPAVGMPGIHGELAGDKRGARVDAVVEDFEQIRPVLDRESGQSPVVEDDERSLDDHLQELDVAAIAMRDPQLLDESGDAPAKYRSALTAGLLRKCAREPGLSRWSRP